MTTLIRRCTLAAGLWIVSGAFALVSAQANKNPILIGEWTVRGLSDDYSGVIRITRQTDRGFTGVINIDEGTTEDLKDGVISGNSVSFRRVWRGSDWEQTFKGTLKITARGEATITGDLEGAGGVNTFEMNKKTPIVVEQPETQARFTSITGQVEISPNPEEVDWLPCTLKTPIRVGDHIMTGDRSTAVIQFEDHSTFVLREKGEIVIATPPGKQTKIGLVTGRLWANINNMLFGDGQLVIEMGQAVAGIKGTTLACERTKDTATLKVIEGAVEFTHKASGKTVLVKAGQMAQAGADRLHDVRPFDVAAEQGQWAPLVKRSETGGEPAAPTAKVEPVTLFDNSNDAGVRNSPTQPTRFTLAQPARVTYLRTYHYNNGAGTAPGTIALREAGGKSYGPFQTKGTGKGSGSLPIMWYVEPDIVLPAGTYTIVDSNPATWSHNAKSGGAGIAWVSGIVQPATAGSAGAASSLPSVAAPGNAAGAARQALGNGDLEAIFKASPQEFKARYEGRPIRVEGIFLQGYHQSRNVILEVADQYRISASQVKDGTPNAFGTTSSFTPAWLSGVIFELRANPDDASRSLLILEAEATFGIQ